MQIKADDDGDFITNDCSNASKKFTFAVLKGLSHHRAMQIQINTVDAWISPDTVQNHFRDSIKRIIGDV